MKKHQQNLQADINELLEICRLRGIGPLHLQASVLDVCIGGVFKDSPVFTHETERADAISSAGLAAQVSFLKRAWGKRRTMNYLENTGGVLDAIVRHTSSNLEELTADIGRDNINDDGDVI